MLKRKNILYLFIFALLLLGTFELCGCTEPNDPGDGGKTNPEPIISNVEVVLDKVKFEDEEVIITGKITYMLNDDELELTLTSDMITLHLDSDKPYVNIKYNADGLDIDKDIELEIIETPEVFSTIKEVKLDKSSFYDDEEVVITGKIVLLGDKGNTKEIDLTNEYFTLPTITYGENKILVKYEESQIYTYVYYYEKTQPLDTDKELGDEVEEYLLSLYEGMTVEANIDFLYEYKGVSIDYESHNTAIISHTGRYTAPIVDKKVVIEYFFYVGMYDYEGTFIVTAKGYGTYADAALDKLVVQSKVYETFTLPTIDTEYGAVYEWYLGDKLCADGIIDVEKQDDDYYITLKCVCSARGNVSEKEFTVLCSMLTDTQKVHRVLKRYNDLFKDMIIEDDVEFPSTDDEFGCKLTWHSFNEDIVSDKGVYRKPFYDISINIKLQAKLGKSTDAIVITTKVVGEHFGEDKWEKIDYFVNRIHQETIYTQKFTLYGCEAGYEYVTTYNEGYLPFYTSDEVKVTVDLLPTGTGLKPDRTRSMTGYITIHNTGMAAPSATAYGLNEYIHTTTRVASWHYSIDDKEAYQHVPLDEVAWHAGDGSTYYGDIWYSSSYNFYGIGGGNNNSVGIEMCVYSGIDFNKAMRNVAKQVSWLLVKYNLNPSRVRGHHDYSGKDCPQVLLHAGRWPEMLELINIEYFARTQLQDVTFKWKSLSPDIMDDTGTVINNPGVETTVYYEVEATYNGVTKTYVFHSLLQKSKK